MTAYGVLLPLGLETRFIPPFESPTKPGEPDPDPHWRLRLRVVPDRASIVEGRTVPSEAELASLDVFWETMALDPTFPDPLPEDPLVRRQALVRLTTWTDAFARLGAHTAPARAAWLIDNVPVSGRPPRTSMEPDLEHRAVHRLLGLPAKLDIWVVWADAEGGEVIRLPEVIGTLQPQRDRLSLDAFGEDPGGTPNDRWWTGWQQACDAGLATEITLQRSPEAIAVLGVSGLRPPEGGSTAAELFAGHAAAGDLAVLRPGVPTSSVFGATAVDTTNASHWMGARPARDPHPVLAALAGTQPPLDVPTDPLLSDHEWISRSLIQLGYPALWGYGLDGVLGISSDAEESLARWEWAINWLRPEGSYPPVRIGDQVYGVLPLAPPGPDVVEGVETVFHDETRYLHSLAGPLGRIVRSWSEAAENGLAAGTPESMLRPLIHGPVPSSLLRQDLIPVLTDAVRTGRSPVDELDAEWSSGRLGEILGQQRWRDHGRLYRRLGGAQPLSIPLLGELIDDGETLIDGAWDDIESNVTEGVGYLDSGVPYLAFLDLPRTPPVSLLVALYRRSLAVSSQVLWNLNGASPNSPILARAGLLEPMLPPGAGARTRASVQTDALQQAGSATTVREPLTWALEPAVPIDVLHACATDPRLRPIATRALRAVIDAASGRWDAWLTGLGAAHAAYVMQTGATPTLGAYGWVDRPYRGTPGPGPGGFHIAPSQAQATTLAVLRDCAVREPDEWSMAYDTDVIGQARRWLADLAMGWHPAELLGRLVEREASRLAAQSGAPDPVAQLRAACPLVPDQGGFGCTNGVHAMEQRTQATHPAILDDASVDAAIRHYERMLDAVADLQLAEGVHTLIHRHPERTGTVTRALGGAERAPMPTFLDPDQRARTVETIVLFAAPAGVPSPGAGPASRAAPGLDQLARSVHPVEPGWMVQKPDGSHVRIGIDDLGGSLLDVATLDPGVLLTLARYAALAGRGTPTAEPADTPRTHLDSVRAWTAALEGRPASAGELDRAAVDGAADAAAQAALADRLSAAVAAAFPLLKAMTDRVKTLEDAETARITHELDTRASDLEPVKERSEAPLTAGDVTALGELIIEAGQWGFVPPDNADKLGGSDPKAAQQAAATLNSFFTESAERLGGRIEAAQAVLERSDVSAAAIAAAIGELIGRPGLPIGSPLPAGSALVRAGSEMTQDWAPTIALVRPPLGRVFRVAAPGDAVALPAGLTLLATEPDDPWRLAALAAFDDLAATSVIPRLTVALAAGEIAQGTALDWVVIDSFAEEAPTTRPVAGASFDAATPSSRPPQAILIVPPPNPDAEAPTDEEIRGLVLYARQLAHARVAVATDLEESGLGRLAAWAALPQDQYTGAVLGRQPEIEAPTFDLPAVLVPVANDGDDVVAAVTSDALWMLGQQWRLGEHAGEDAASPVQVTMEVADTPIAYASSNPAHDVAVEPLEACLEVESAEAGGWKTELLHYTDELVISSGQSLEVPVHDGGPSGWWEVTARGPAPEAARRQSRSHPTQLDYPGQPTGRYWQIDSRRHDVAGSGPDRTQPATLHLIHLLTRHGEDIYTIPVAATPGTVLRPRDVWMVDAAGGEWRLRPPPDWHFTSIAGLDPMPPGPADADDWQRATLILNSAPAALEGPVLDDLAIAIDEDDNLVWAAELRIDGAIPDVTPVPPRIAKPDDDSTATSWAWTLRRPVPAHRFPFLHGSAITVPATGANEDMFTRARLVGPDGEIGAGPQSVLLSDTPRLAPLAVPSTGVRLTRLAMLSRGVDGRPVLWWRRAKRPLDVPVDVDLRWDPLELGRPPRERSSDQASEST